MAVIEKTNTIGSGRTLPFKHYGVPTNGTNEVQTLTIANATGGSLRLGYDGFTTAPITWSAVTNTLLANIQAALDALPNLAANEVVAADATLSGGNGTLTLTFGGNSAKKNVSQITVTSALTGTGATAAVTTTTPGVTATGRGLAFGSTLLDTENGVVYQNMGSALEPDWTNLSATVTGDLADEAVTAAKLATDAVETAKIKNLNVTAAKLASDAVETAKIKDLNVTTGKLAADAVETAKIKDLNVTTGKLAAGAVTVAKSAAAALVRVWTVVVENLAADADIAARAIFCAPEQGATLTKIGIIAQGTAGAAPAASPNDAVVAIKDAAGNTIVTETFDEATAWPADAIYLSLGALDGTHKVLAANEVVTLDVTTNGLADLPPFLVAIEWQPADPA